jgi:hypothetical protein
MFIDPIQDDFDRLQEEIQQGPIYPNVTAEEIRNHLASRYEFSKKMPLDEVIADRSSCNIGPVVPPVHRSETLYGACA